MSKAVLEVSNLQVAFHSKRESVTVLRDVSFSVHAGKTLALVGESGSGKSVTSLAIMGLLPNNGLVTKGHIQYCHQNGTGVELTSTHKKEMRTLRGAKISMIFQEPMSSLNPLFTIGDQIGEMLLLHTSLDAATRKKRVIEMLELVEMPAATLRFDTYPHELSGGMRQRAMIALAMICNPALLIADEPTTALDVTIQAQILDLMRRLQKEFDMSILFITHDMGVVAEMADDVAVMYAGKVVEHASADAFFAQPRHPYAKGLLASIPSPNLKDSERLVSIPGTVPPLNNMPSGCAFSPRCRYADTCCNTPVNLTEQAKNHWVACVKASEVFARG